MSGSKMNILVIVEHDGAVLKLSTFNSVTAACQLAELIKGEVHLLVAGQAVAEVSRLVRQIPGVSKVWTAENSAYALAEPMAQLVERLMRSEDYAVLLAPAATGSKNLLPRVAARLDVAPISDVVTIIAADTFVRPIYAGNALATVRSKDRLKVLTVRATSFAPAPSEGGNAIITELPAADECGVSHLVGRQLTDSERPELASARVVIAGGRGLGSRDAFSLLNSIADRLGAAVGASRAAVDAGFVPNDCQVGQTGKIVAPDLYIAVGISGAIQHVAGMKDSKVIVAINKDEEAPIFQIADYGLVADLFTALPELVVELSR